MSITREDFDVIYPDDGGAVIIRLRRPWPVPFPILADVQETDEDLPKAA